VRLLLWAETLSLAPGGLEVVVGGTTTKSLITGFEVNREADSDSFWVSACSSNSCRGEEDCCADEHLERSDIIGDYSTSIVAVMCPALMRYISGIS
jgi:hypothetical protein